MNERIRLLREKKGLSRAAFGERIGVSGDVINNLERGRVEVKEHIIKLISTEFGVTEEWLRNGTEPMRMQPETFSLDEFAAQHNATDLEKEIIKTYFEIDPAIRRQILNHFKENLMGAGGAPDSPEELEIMHPPVTGDEKTNAG